MPCCCTSAEIHYPGWSIRSSENHTHIALKRFFSRLKSTSPGLSLPSPLGSFASALAFSVSSIVHSQAGYCSSGRATGSGWSLRIERPVRVVPARQDETAEYKLCVASSSRTKWEMAASRAEYIETSVDTLTLLDGFWLRCRCETR